MSEERRWGDGPEACPLGGASGGDGTGGTGREGWSLHAAPLLPRPQDLEGAPPSPPPQQPLLPVCSFCGSGTCRTEITNCLLQVQAATWVLSGLHPLKTPHLILESFI